MYVNSAVLGAEIRRRREQVGLSQEDAAALLGVGKRFLNELERDKKTAQLQMAIDVAARLGIRLVFSGPSYTSEATRAGLVYEPAEITISPPSGDATRWLAGRVIGSLAAAACGFAVWRYQYQKSPPELIYRSSGNVRQAVFSASRHLVPETDYRKIARFITDHSDLAILDIRTVAARAVLTVLFADITWDLGNVWMTDVDGVVRLAPFPIVSCEAEVSQGGMLIGNETPSEWLRADHFISLAKDLGIAPKVIFGLMSELTQSVPQAVEAAVRKVYPNSYHRGHGAELVRAVRARSVRLGDVVSSAGYQGIAGIAKPISLVVKREEDDSSYIGHETIYD